MDTVIQLFLDIRDVREYLVGQELQGFLEILGSQGKLAAPLRKLIQVAREGRVLLGIRVFLGYQDTLGIQPRLVSMV